MVRKWAMCCRSMSLRCGTKGGAGRASFQDLDFSRSASRSRSCFTGNWRLPSRGHSPRRLVPLRPFCGIMGVAPAEQENFARVRRGSLAETWMCANLPRARRFISRCCRTGPLFSCGDAHAAQGNGEVCVNGIECPADISLRFRLHKQTPLAGPLVESSSATDADGSAWVVVASSADALDAARTATNRMVDLLRADGALKLCMHICCAALR